jgi:hypothetical protein
MFHIRATALVLLLALNSLRAQSSDVPTLAGTYDPFLLALKPALQMSALPPWVEESPRVDMETALVELEILPAWRAPGVDFFAVTVVFNDNGDGGPALEWRTDGGVVSTISYGIGEIGKPVGLNSRTVLLPQVLTRDGGTLILSYYGKFQSLLSLAVRPAREDGMAVLGARRFPILVDGDLQVFEEREVNGTRQVPLAGDVSNGSIVEAELAAQTEQLEDSIGFIVPLEGKPEAAMLRLETLGLDPEARLEVWVNDHPVGSVNLPGFQLDDPSLVADWNGNLVLAGWRKGSLFLAARHLQQGDNSIVIRLSRSPVETCREVFLRNTGLHLRFAAAPWSPPSEPMQEMPADVDGLRVAPDFSLADPAIPEAIEPPLPEVVTSPGPTESTGASAR